MADRVRLSQDEFVALAHRLDRGGRWGPDDELGALHFVTPERTLAAAALVADGEVVRCGAPLDLASDDDGPRALLELTLEEGDGWFAVNDRLSLDLHGMGSMTHLDSLAHFSHLGRGWSGATRASVSPSGVRRNAITTAAGGIVTRGVLVDLPAALGRPWLEDRDCVGPGDIERWLAGARVELRSGDVVFFRTGTAPRRAATLGRRPRFEDLPGLSIGCAPLIHDAEVAVVVTDAGTDVGPSEVEGVGAPWHVLALVYLGVRLVDNAELEALAATCRRLGRWEFLCALAPLDLPGATSSPLSPLAVF